ncbi:MAG TPA: tRNA glutamyl-Q(34) synthetase GluQRS [Chthoniobacterales bacterium]
MAIEYRGRIAPSPTGHLHVGHAITFWRAQERSQANAGLMILRIEDLDPQRCRPEFYDALIEDLKWFGFKWDEGPDVGGPFAPYLQSRRRSLYLDAWKQLRAGGWIYPCCCSRKDVLQAAIAPHDEDEEPVYPGTCRPENISSSHEAEIEKVSSLQPGGVHWRFRVPDGENLTFFDQRLGQESAIAGKDFGDFVVWRKDDVPAYQLAVVVDDTAMGVTEVVRGEDLLTSTFRQLLLYRALGKTSPRSYHAPLIRDELGKRLAKRHRSLSLRSLRESGITPGEIRIRYAVDVAV